MDSFISRYSLGGNWVDLVFIGVVLYYILTNKGIISSTFDILGFILSLLFAYRVYHYIGILLVSNFGFSPGISNAAGFFIAWMFAELLLYIIFSLVILHVFDRYKDHPLNRYLGYAGGVAQAFVISLFYVSVVFALPIRGEVKKAIIDSRTGGYLVEISQSTEKSIKNVLGGAVSETINFLTIKPQSSERLSLGFTLTSSQMKPDPESEAIMLRLVNKERRDRGVPELVQDDQLVNDSRLYAQEMFKNGFFSHHSAVDGSTPGDRANRLGIEYGMLGENLAFAPDVYIAHQGLMNSEGHRRNILEPSFKKVGIGVIDGGFYGRMFVQTFSD